MSISTSMLLFLLGLAIFIVYIIVLVADMRMNEIYVTKKLRLEKARKEAEKRKKPKEFEWPNYIPRIF